MEVNSSNEKQNALMLGAAFLIACGIVFGAYHSVLNCGFLLDDYHHLGYAYYANHGDPSALMRTFTGNWSGQTDGLTSFRPGISLSFWLDNLLFGLNAVGYHFTNLVVFSGCTFLCGILGYQLTANASRKERWLTGFAAIVLFATYPIHAESVSWIVGRVDIHCTFFYLLSISLYLHFRKAVSIASFFLSIASFCISLICKEMAVTLPVVILFAEVLLSNPLNWRVLTVRKRLIYVGSYFGTLLVFGVVRTLLLGTLVGGYGKSGLRAFFRTARDNFTNAETFGKILMGVNEELPFPAVILKCASFAWLVAAVSLVGRFAQPTSRLKVILFLFLWLVVAQLPTFQIWHIHPNLVGSRLFFLGSSALCLLLAVSLIPAIRFTERLAGKGKKMVSKVVWISGIAALIVLTVTWSIGLTHNLYPFIEAGRQMQSANAKLRAEAQSTGAGECVVLIDLPQDLSGAGLIGRHEYLASMLNKPISDADYASKFVTLARPIPGPIEYIYPNLLATLYGDSRCRKFLHWSKDDGGYVDWSLPDGVETLDVSEFPPVDEEQPRTPKSKRSDSKGPSERKGFSKNGNRETATNPQLRLNPGAVTNPSQPLCVWLSKGYKINPLKISAVETQVSSSIELPQLARNARLIWRSERQPKSWIDYSVGPFAEVRNGKLLFMPGRFRSWVLNGSVVDLGIQFLPGQYTAQVQSVKNVDRSLLSPAVNLIKTVPSSLPDQTPQIDRSNQDLTLTVENKILPVVNANDVVTVSVDASEIAGAQSVLLVVTKTDIACPDLPITVIPDDSQLILKKILRYTTGSFQLPREACVQKGKHQVAALALDSKENPVGYISEPRTYFVSKMAQ